jgi:hypothetical protein
VHEVEQLVDGRAGRQVADVDGVVGGSSARSTYTLHQRIQINTAPWNCYRTM